jgi:hypothetical protein
MASKALKDIIKQVEQLTPAEQMELLAALAEKAKESRKETSPRYQWRELRGIAPDMLDGEDAQEWVSRTRRESEESRQRQLNFGAK